MATSTSPPKPSPPKTAADGKSYYGYLYQDDKAPTPIFNALLRSLAQYVMDNIGDTEEKALNPKKLATFYATVGIDYDALFLESGHEAISFIWQVTGCQHSLNQPIDNDFAAPTIPTLTPKGFLRWQSVETLLCPDIHVPLLQYAVKNWNLKNPDTGDEFPPDLPAEALPSEPDAEIEAWHNRCANKLRREAESPKMKEPTSPDAHFKEGVYNYTRPFATRTSAASVSTSPPHAPRHPSPPLSRTRIEPNDGPRPAFARYVPAAAAGFAATVGAASMAYRFRHQPTDEHHAEARRRSFSDYPPPDMHEPKIKIVHHPPHSASNLETGNRNMPMYRNGHPRRSSSSDSTEEEKPRVRSKKMQSPHVRHLDEPSMTAGRHPYHSPPGVPDVHPAMPVPGMRESSSSSTDRRRRDDRAPRLPPRSPHRSPHRTDELPQRKGQSAPRGIHENVAPIPPSGVLGGGGRVNMERPRSTSRTKAFGVKPPEPRYPKDNPHSFRPGRSPSLDSDDDAGARARERRRREVELERDHGRDRDRDEDRDYKGRHDYDRGPNRSRERDRERDRGRDRDTDRDRDRDKEKDKKSRSRDKDRGEDRDKDDNREYRRPKGYRDRPWDSDRSDRDRDRDRDREHRHRDQDWGRNRERDRDQYRARQEQKRPGSHGDMERDRRSRCSTTDDSRERDWDRERERRKRDVLNSNTSQNSLNSHSHGSSGSNKTVNPPNTSAGLGSSNSKSSSNRRYAS